MASTLTNPKAAEHESGEGLGRGKGCNEILRPRLAPRLGKEIIERALMEKCSFLRSSLVNL